MCVLIFDNDSAQSFNMSGGMSPGGTDFFLMLFNSFSTWYYVSCGIECWRNGGIMMSLTFSASNWNAFLEKLVTSLTACFW